MPQHHLQHPARHQTPVQQIGHPVGLSSASRYPVPQFPQNQVFDSRQAAGHGSLLPTNYATVPKPPSAHGLVSNNGPSIAKSTAPHSPYSSNHHYRPLETVPPVSAIPPPPSHHQVENHRHSPQVSPQFAPHPHALSPVRAPQVPVTYNATVPVVPPPQTSHFRAVTPGTRPSYNPGAPPPLSNYPAQAPNPQEMRTTPAWSPHPPGTTIHFNLLGMVALE